MFSADTLFRRFSVKSLSLPNRIIMAPPSTCAVNGMSTEDHEDHYLDLAKGGAALILTDQNFIGLASAIDGQTSSSIHGDAALAKWKGAVDLVHAARGHIGLRLTNARVSKGRSSGADEVALADAVVTLVQSAVQAKYLGFDVIEIDDPSDGFSDDEGTAAAERSGFSSEVISAIRVAIGPDLPIVARLRQSNGQHHHASTASTPNTIAAWLSSMVEAGADILHCMEGHLWGPVFPEIDGSEGLTFAGWAKKVTGAAIISNGSNSRTGDTMDRTSPSAGLDELTRRLGRDEFDLVAVGSGLFNGPGWTQELDVNSFARVKDVINTGQLELH